MSKKKIEIRGTIVDSVYDTADFWDYIRNGTITPDSYVRKQMKDIQPTDEVEVVISSNGGSVFAGNNMLADIQDIAKTNKLTVNIGSMAASMGSALMVGLQKVGAKVIAHDTSKLMFHSAASGVIGGPQAMEDEAQLLRKINADTQTYLLSKGVPAEKVQDGYSEGRMLWLDAQEAKQYGLVDEIVGGDKPEAIKVSVNAKKAFATANLDLSKYIQEGVEMEVEPEVVPEVAETEEAKVEETKEEVVEEKKEEVTEEQVKEATAILEEIKVGFPVEEPEQKEQEQVVVEIKDVPVQVISEIVEQVVEEAKVFTQKQIDALIKDNDSAIQSAITNITNELTNKHTLIVQEKDKEINALKLEVEALKEKSNKAEAKVEVAKAKVKELGINALTVGKNYNTFQEAVNELGYVKARKECHDLFLAQLPATKRK